jgi:xanthine dehydrogenase YagS FAD-binding subunit
VKPFTYARPSTVTAAVQALANGSPRARIIAGGTTLYDLMKLDIEAPQAIVDVSRLGELTTVDTAGTRELVFGAMARMSDIAADRTLQSEYPALAESLWRAASPQVRNMATVGGNLLQRTRCAYFRGGEPYPCNKRQPGSGCAAIGGLDRGHAILGTSTSCIAVYPGDWAVALVAFDAQLDTVSPRGERTIAVAGLHREPGATPHLETILEPDELIVRIRVPVTAAGRASTYHKIRDRASYAFALTSAAVAVRLDGDTVEEARIALGGVATRPWRTGEAERALVGRALTDATARAAGDAAFTAARTGQYNRFKVELGARTIAEALMIAKGRARTS